MKRFKKTTVLLVTIFLFSLFTSVCFAEDDWEGDLGDDAGIQLLREQVLLLEEKLQKMEEENDARRSLQVTDDEEYNKEEAVLSAAGRNYTLMKPGALGLEYSFDYTGDSYSAVDSSAGTFDISDNSKHTLTNGLFVEYPFKENITLNTNVSFVYKYQNQSNADAKDVSDLGDTSFGFLWQPLKSGGDFPSMILNGSLTCPTGRSPYKIDPQAETSTGGGGYAFSTGVNLSKSIDPLVAFGGLSYRHGIPITGLTYKPGSGNVIQEVRPGDQISYNLGIGYSLSYQVSISLGYQYTYSMAPEYTVQGVGTVNGESEMYSSFSIGTSWNLSPERSVHVKLNFGLTKNDTDFSLSVRIPFSYDL
ncbi:hypothetical protein DSLASN_11890 [Desulfoluna limicola]|uniref:Transporter n=1 Tax=Desulfoluna limicola TaxID=2810562 RepID=A0ABM7PEE5_9BACT|nr:hypothetical protein DSLASN_11890 [Desulfoluna limicola]